LKLSILIAALVLAALALPCRAQRDAFSGKTLLVMPFQNNTKTPDLDWIGESFPEVLGGRLTGFFVIDRQDRLNAFDRMGLPANMRPTRATAYQVAQAMEVDYVIVGSYAYDGQSFTARAQVLDMERLHLSAPVVASGTLPALIQIENLLARDLMHLLAPARVPARIDSAEPHLDAFENYIRGVSAASRQEKIARLRDAVRLDPNYSRAIFQLGKALYDGRDYAAATAWFEHIPQNDGLAREASFYRGLCEFYLGHYEKAQSAFEFVAARLPLTEVYNNLGVVAERRGNKSAVAFFERAVEADPSDPDYRFNLAIALARNADAAGAASQLRQLLTLAPSDEEAKTLLAALTHPPVMAGTATASATLRPAEVKLPLEHIKRNYDEASFRELAFELENQSEARLAKKPSREHAQFHVERGQDLLSQGFLGEAEKQFREAIILDPTSATAHLGLARIMAADRPSEARAEAHSALVLQPSADAWLVLARLDLRDNKVEAARDDVDHALQLEPANASAVAMKHDIATRLAGQSQSLTNQ
jgi:tetratricopeptide (TPR) repeat protein